MPRSGSRIGFWTAFTRTIASSPLGMEKKPYDFYDPTRNPRSRHLRSPNAEWQALFRFHRTPLEGQSHRAEEKMSRLIDITGNKYGRLTALSAWFVKNKETIWIFSCICGQKKSINKANVVSGKVNSCGCLVKDNPGPTPQDPRVRFWRHVKKTEGCWEWTGKRTKNGYGWFSVSHGKGALAHRYGFLIQNGPIPVGLSIDHLCKNTSCIRGDHLDAVTQHVNNLRSECVSGINSRKKACIHGHNLSGDNLRVYSNPITGKRMRICRTCMRLRKRNRRQLK